MSEYRFIGTLKEIESSSGNKILRFVPDLESAVAENHDDKKIKYIALLPQKGKEGIVIEYEDNVAFTLTMNPDVEWLLKWKPDGHYRLTLLLETVNKMGDQETSGNGNDGEKSNGDDGNKLPKITLDTIDDKGNKTPSGKQFQLKSVTEKT